MSVHLLPLTEITQRAKIALINELGVSDTLRFLHQFRTGSGNYTLEREQLQQGESVKSIVASIKASRTSESK